MQCLGNDEATLVESWSEDRWFASSKQMDTDATFGKDAKTGCLGAILVSSTGCCVAWFLIFLDKGIYNIFGADGQEIIV